MSRKCLGSVLAEGDGAQRREQAARRPCEPVGCGECSRRERHRGEEGGGEVGESDGELQLLRERGVGRVVEERPSPIPPESRIRCGPSPVRRVRREGAGRRRRCLPLAMERGAASARAAAGGRGRAAPCRPRRPGRSGPTGRGGARARPAARLREGVGDAVSSGGTPQTEYTLETVSRPPTASEAGVTRREDSPSEIAGSLTHARRIRL